MRKEVVKRLKQDRTFTKWKEIVAQNKEAIDKATLMSLLFKMNHLAIRQIIIEQVGEIVTQRRSDHSKVINWLVIIKVLYPLISRLACHFTIAKDFHIFKIHNYLVATKI